MTKTKANSSAPAIAAAIEFNELGTPEGYTPKEAALMLKTAGYPADGKKVRRLLRAGKLNGVQFSGRWYIPVQNFKNYVAKLQAAPAETEAASAS